MRRYVDSLMPAELHSVAEPVPRRATAAAWWRRYLASLLDVPAVGDPSARAARPVAGMPVATSARPAPPAHTPRRDLDASGSPFGVEEQATPSSFRRFNLREQLRATLTGARVVVLAATAFSLVAVVLTVVSVQQRHDAASGVNAGVGMPSPSTETVNSHALAPSGSPTPGQVVWQGTVVFVAKPGEADTWPVVTNPPTELLDGGLSLVLCTASCRPPNITGESFISWPGTKPPTRDQCAALLASLRPTGTTGFIPLRPGQKACFSLGGPIGSLSVLTTSPDVSASAVIWAS